MNIAYPRKSTESEDRQVASIPAQITELKALAARVGEPIDRIMEESRSAREPGRPVFQELVRMIERGEVGSVYVWKLDRLSRNPVDGGILIHYLGHHRLKRIVTPDRIFTGTPDDKLLMQIEFGMATKFVDDLSANVKRGNRDVLRSGRSPGRVPLGYRKGPTSSAGRGAGNTMVDPIRFPLLQKLWQMLLTDRYSLRELHDHAKKLGLTTRPTRKLDEMAVSRAGLYGVFSNPFYCGRLVAGGETYAGTHELAVTPAEFARAQKILGRSDRRRPYRHVFLYSGLLRCGQCGRGMVGEAHANRYGTRYVYYRCTRKNPGYHVCTAPYVAEKTIDAAVEEALRRLVFPSALLDWISGNLDEWLAGEATNALARETAVKQQIGEREGGLHRLTDLLLRNVVPETEYVRERTRLMGELESLRADLAVPTASAERWRAACARVLDTAATAEADYQATDLTRRREILGTIAEAIVVTDRTPVIALRRPFDVFAATSVVDEETPGRVRAGIVDTIDFWATARGEAGGRLSELPT